jgi:hypothetical protein
MKKEGIQKKHYIVYLLIALALFFLGIFIGITFLRPTTSQIVENCRKFCEFIPDTEFSHVGNDNHCFCLQRNQRLYDSLLNKTLIYSRIIDVGIITEAIVKNYIE